LPVSRQRKTGKARKRPKGLGSSSSAASTTSRNERRVKTLAIVVVAALLLAGGIYFFSMRSGGSGSGKEVTTASGLKYIDIAEGTGPTPKKGQTVSVKYTGSLPSGKVFDSTDRHGGKPYEFSLGKGGVIKGWDEAIATMKVAGNDI